MNDAYQQRPLLELVQPVKPLIATSVGTTVHWWPASVCVGGRTERTLEARKGKEGQGWKAKGPSIGKEALTR